MFVVIAVFQTQKRLLFPFSKFLKGEKKVEREETIHMAEFQYLIVSEMKAWMELQVELLKNPLKHCELLNEQIIHFAV